jgi:ABC-type sulfate/molybdate transport systems ATPase subunit
VLVDAHTAKHLYQECLMGPLMKDRTRIIVTHHVKLFLNGCSLLVHIENGTIGLVGSPAELGRSGILSNIIEENSNNDLEEEEEGSFHRIESTTTVSTTTTRDSNHKSAASARVLVERESRASGSVKIKL